MTRARWLIVMLCAVGFLAFALATLPTAPQTVQAETVGSPLQQGSCSTYSSATTLTIPDASPAGITSTISLPPLTTRVTYVQVSLGLNHTYPSDLAAYLTTPDLCESQIFSVDQLSARDHVGSLSFANNGTKYIEYTDFPYPGVYRPNAPFSSNFRAGGRWTLHMVDDVGGDEGQLTGWSVTLCTGGVLPPGTMTPSPTVSPTPTSTPTGIPTVGLGDCAIGIYDTVWRSEGDVGLSCQEAVAEYLGTATRVPGHGNTAIILSGNDLEMFREHVYVGGDSTERYYFMGSSLTTCPLGYYDYTATIGLEHNMASSDASGLFGDPDRPVSDYNTVVNSYCTTQGNPYYYSYSLQVGWPPGGARGEKFGEDFTYSYDEWRGILGWYTERKFFYQCNVPSTTYNIQSVPYCTYQDDQDGTFSYSRGYGGVRFSNNPPFEENPPGSDASWLRLYASITSCEVAPIPTPCGYETPVPTQTPRPMVCGTPSAGGGWVIW